MLELDFLVIGAQKCATSWMYLCLAEHPQLHLANNKDEANYYAGERHRDRGDQWFKSLYTAKPGARLRGSVSVDYLHDARALYEIATTFSRARFVVCLRDPLQRTASAWAFLIRRSKLPNESLDALVDAALQDFSAGRSTEAVELVTRSLYGAQLLPLARAQALDRLLIVSYDRLRVAPLESLQAIYEFLGVDSAWSPRSLGVRPKHNSNLPALIALERLAPSSRVMAKLMDYSNRLAARTRFARGHPEYSNTVERRFREILRDDAQLLAAHLSVIPGSQKIAGPELSDIWGLLASETSLQSGR